MIIKTKQAFSNTFVIFLIKRLIRLLYSYSRVRPAIYSLVIAWMFLGGALESQAQVSGQANFLTVSGPPANATVDAGGTYTATIAGTVKANAPVTGDEVISVEISDNGIGIKSVLWPVDLVRGEIANNNTRSFSLSIPLAIGSHSLMVTAETYNGGSGQTQSFPVTIVSNVPVVSAPVNNAIFTNQTVLPSSLELGRMYPVVITMKNTGGTVWSPGGNNPYRLGVQGSASDSSTLSAGRVDIFETVVSGQSTDFVVNVVPTAVGNFTFQWQMLQEGIEWFGAKTTAVPVTVIKKAISTAFTTPTVDQTVAATSTTADVTFTGTATPSSSYGIKSLVLSEGATQFGSGAATAAFGTGSVSATRTLSLGTHTITLTATDTSGATTSATRTVVVTTMPPTVKISTPASNTTVTTTSGAATVTFAGSATPATGATIANLVLRENGVTFATGTGTTVATVSGSKSLSLGSHTIELVATDSKGLSASTTRIVNVGTSAPTAAFSSPIDGTSYSMGSKGSYSVPVSASGTAGAGATITKLALYLTTNGSTTNIYNATTGSISLNLTLSPGEYTFGVEATDSANAVSARKNVTIKLVPVIPVVTLTAPANGAIALANGTTAAISVSGSVNVNGGTAITKLELIDNGNVIATPTVAATYSANVNLAPGTHSLQLRATNSAGGQGISAISLLTVYAQTQGNYAKFLSQDIPTSYHTGQPGMVTVRMFNSGTTTWNATGTNAYKLGTQNLQDNTQWNVTARGYLASNTAPGQVATFVIPITAPQNSGTYNMQWKMVQEYVEWFGDLSDNKAISITAGGSPVVSLSGTSTNVRVSGTQTATVAFAAIATAPSGRTLTKLELFQGTDTADYSNTTPVASSTLTTSSATWAPKVAVTAGVYLFKVRATDSAGVATESKTVFVNVTNSALLGSTSGVRSNASEHPELFGWVCQPGSATALGYTVYLDAPTPGSGGKLLTTGTANVATEIDNASVQSTCSTPGTAHQFVVDLSSYIGQYAGRSLYVSAKSADGTQTVTLPCVDNNCTMPSTLNVALTTPLNGDQVVSPNPVFARMKLKNFSGTYDEVGFYINGQWTAAQSEGTGTGLYSASISSLPINATPYIIYAKVRQGNTTVLSVQNQFTVVATATATITLSSPSNGSTVALGAQTIAATLTGSATSVKFFVNDAQLSGSASGGGANWSQTWTPAAVGNYTLYVRAYDANGVQIVQSASVTVTVSATATSNTPVAITVAAPHLGNADAGTLPGTMAIDGSANATYHLPLVVPPGTNGMAPDLSLDYKDDGPNGLLGLGWSMTGLSSIHRCGKTIAQDSVNARINFTTTDRLCLDGQRLVLVNKVLTDTNYWTVGAEYRTEIDSFSQIILESNGPGGGLSFRVKLRNGRVATYGSSETSYVKAIVGTVNSGTTASQPQGKGGAQSWAIDRMVDRSGNYIAFSYEQDNTTGEHRPSYIRYGGNTLPSHAAVKFSYEPRQDAWKRYIDETRNDLRDRVSHIQTYVGGNLDGTAETAGTLVRDYTLTYKQSPSSGRSLLTSINSCARDPDAKPDAGAAAMACLPQTLFSWGEPDVSKAAGFTSRGVWANAPILTTYNAKGSDGTFQATNHADYFAFSDVDGDGFADVLEKRVASPVPLDLNQPDGALRESSNPKAPGTVQTSYNFYHNTGAGFVRYTYDISTQEFFVVLDVGDFNGDGKLDLFVSTPNGARICLNPLTSASSIGAAGGNIRFACTGSPSIAWNNTTGNHAYLFDAVGDGRSAVYSTIDNNNKARFCNLQGCQDDANPPPVLDKDDQNFDKSDGTDNVLTREYVSFNQMVDFAGIGKPYDTRWTQFFFKQYTYDSGEWFKTNSSYNLTPTITMTSLGAPGTASNNMADYTYNAYPLPTGIIRAPYVFDRPYQGNGLSADFNGSGYNSLAFGFIETGYNALTGYSNNRAEMTICLSTGRALDCGVRQKYSGSQYRYITALGNFVGDGSPAILTQPVAVQSQGTRPAPTGAIEVCRVLGEDTTGDVRDGNIVCTPWSGPTVPEEGTNVGDHVYFMDLLGTGRPQMVYYHSGTVVNNAWKENGQWEVFEPNDRAVAGQALDRIYKVTNGLGVTQAVEYADGLSSGVIGSTNVARTYPVQATQQARKVARRLTLSNGVGSNRSVSYQYYDGATDISGRGSLGFATVVATDDQTGFKTTTTYSQTWPTTGMVLSATTATTTGCAISSTSNQPQAQSIVHKDVSATYAPTYFTYIAGSTTARHDLNCADLGTAATVNEYTDSWGNLNKQTVTTTGAGTFITTTQTTYRNDASGWLIGLPTHMTTNKTFDASKAGLTRTIDFDYDTTTGLLSTETVEKANTLYQVVTAYDRSGNTFGLVSKKTLTWLDPVTNMSKSRIASNTTYDGNGRYPATVANALNQSETYGYYPGTGARKSAIDANGLTTSWATDGFGRVTSETLPNGIKTWHYVKACDSTCPVGAAVAQIVDVFNGNSRMRAPVVQYSDSVGHLLRTLSWGIDGTKPIFADQTYDGRGRPYQQYWPHFEKDTAYLQQRQEYDDLDRVITVTTLDDIGGEHAAMSDYKGYVTTLTNVLSQKRTETRNAIGQLSQVLDANGKTTLFEYDEFGNLSKTTDPGTNVITVKYDLLGRKTELRDPDLGFIAYTVDPLGRVIAQQSPNQRTSNAKTGRSDITKFQFDDLDRMTARLETDLESHWEFDTAAHGVGQLAQAYTMAGANKDYLRAQTYDALGRPDTTTQTLYKGTDGIFTSRQEYDAWSRPIRQTYQRYQDSKLDAAKAFDSRYGSTGNLVRIERNGVALWTLLTEDASLHSTSIALGNGLSRNATANVYTNRVTNAVLNDAKSTAHVVENYVFDLIGNVTTRTQSLDTASFQETMHYDNLNRLDRSTVLSLPDQVFTYDDAGNIKSKTGVGTSTGGVYTYPTQGSTSVRPHAVQSIVGLGSFGYDDNGNMLSGPARNVTWTSFDMPAAITSGSVSSSFLYGTEHQRVRQVRSDGTTLIYAGAQEVEQTATQTTVKTYWPNGIGVEIDKAGTTQLNWIHADRLGSVIGYSDASGILTTPLGYDAWGKRRTPGATLSNGTTTPDSLNGGPDNRGFTGHEMLDNLELVHMNGRVYDPLVGRFLSGDPLVSDLYNGQSYNRYSYVLNNPTNLTDPTGFADEIPTEELQKSAPSTGTHIYGNVTNAVCSGNCNESPSAGKSAHKQGANDSKNQQANKVSENSSGMSTSETGGKLIKTSSVTGTANDGTPVEQITGTYSRYSRVYATPSQLMMGWISFDPIYSSLRWMGLSPRVAAVGGFAFNLVDNPKALIATGLTKFGEKNAGTLFYHYTDEAGAKAIQESGMLLPNGKGQVFLTQEKLTQQEANNMLFLGRGGERGSHVVEVMVRDGVPIVPGKNPNEFIYRGVMRDGRQADMTVGPNGF